MNLSNELLDKIAGNWPHLIVMIENAKASSGSLRKRIEMTIAQNVTRMSGKQNITPMEYLTLAKVAEGVSRYERENDESL